MIEQKTMVNTSKLPLKRKDTLPLKLFFFIVQETINLINPSILPIKLEIGYGYTEREVAEGLVKKFHNNEPNLTLKSVGAVDAEVLLSALDLSTASSKKTKEVTKDILVTPKKNKINTKITAQNFVYNLKYSKEKFKKLFSETDNKALDTIIKKLNNKLK